MSPGEPLADQAAQDVLAGLASSGESIPVAVRQLLRKVHGEAQKTLGDSRPWGSEAVLLQTRRVRVTRLDVNPGAALAPQMHSGSSGHWVVVEGRAQITIGDLLLEAGPDESRYIPARTVRSLQNPGRTRLVVIAVECAEDLFIEDIDATAEKLRNADVAGAARGSRSIRVLHVYKTFLPDSVGGLENAIAQMAVATRRLGLDVRILSLSADGAPRSCRYRNIEHQRYKETLSVASNAMSLPMLRDFGRQVEWADVIHYHFPWPFADALHLLWRVRKPSIVTYHSDIVRQRRLMLLYRPLMRAFLGRVDRIVATSPNYAQTSDVLRDYPGKTTVIPIGLDPASYPATRPDRLEYWKQAVGENFFLFIGVIRYYKGLHILLDALAGTPLSTVIVGSGPIENELRRHAQQAGLEHVRFLGTVSEDDKVALLDLSMAVVFPSHLRSEAFGVTLLEGAMFAKPLISSEIGTGTSYININGETGIVVPPSDPEALRAAMLRLAGDPGLRARMGAAARRRFEERFTADRMAAQYLVEYRALLTKAALPAVEAQQAH